MAQTLLGDWKLDSSENFEALMKELGVGLIFRKVGATTKPNVKLEVNGDEWTMTTTSAIKTHATKFKLDTEFEEETVDGRKVLTTITWADNKLVQTQKDLKNNNVVCVITREMNGDGVMKTVSDFFFLFFKLGKSLLILFLKFERLPKPEKSNQSVCIT